VKREPPDPLTVDALVQSFPMPGATGGERRAAAIIMLDRGWSAERISLVLRVPRETVNKWGERDRKAKTHHG